MSQPHNAIEVVLDVLSQEGISHVFMVPGGFLTEFGDVTGVNAIVADQRRRRLRGCDFCGDSISAAILTGLSRCKTSDPLSISR